MTLHLVLKKKWFDMIASGDKKEEYRDINKYWDKRLCCGWDERVATGNPYKKFNTVTFQLGYQKNAPRVIVEFISIKPITKGNVDWGFEKPCFCIKLGKIISKKNF